MTGPGSAVAGGESRAPGLVSSSTSGTRLELDPIASRMRRLRVAVSTSARLHELETSHGRGRRSHRPAMLTLTYRDGSDWRPRHVADLLQRVRVWLKRRGHGFRYVWVAELQQRGAIHYHVLVWLPRGLTLPKPDKQGWWPHGSTNIAWARKPVGYLCKYASKLDSKAGQGYPAGARLHGRGGLEQFRAVASWFGLPSWARALFGVACRAVRVSGGGLASRETGVHVSSPWRVSRGERGCYFAEQVFTYLGGMRDRPGPFSWLPGCGPAYL